MCLEQANLAFGGRNPSHVSVSCSQLRCDIGCYASLLPRGLRKPDSCPGGQIARGYIPTVHSRNVKKRALYFSFAQLR